MFDFTRRDVAEMNAAQARWATIDEVWIFIGDVQVAAFPDVVIKIHGERTQHTIHDQVRDANVFNGTTASAPRFDADTAIRADEDTIGDNHILNAAAHFTA